MNGTLNRVTEADIYTSYTRPALERNLALDQIKQHANTTESEVWDMLHGNPGLPGVGWSSEMLGIEEPLV
jgi:hypothetical protein